MNKLFQKNLEFLTKNNKRLAKKIEKLKINDYKNDFEILNFNKLTTLKIYTDQFQKLVHSKYNPKKQAKKRIENLKLKNHNLIGVCGIGCGYYIEEIAKNIDNGSRLIIFENRLDILKEVMKNRDLKNIFNKKFIKIIDTTDSNYSNRVKNLFKRIDYVSLAMGNINFFKTPGLRKIEKKKYNEIKENFFSNISFISQTLGNSSEDSLLGLDNILNNSKSLLRNLKISNLKKFKGEPAICVAAGPSLDKNIDLLKKHQNKALIIACDTVLEKLLKNDIRPDIVGVLERGENVYKYFFKDLIKKNMIPDDIVLIADGVAHPKIFDNFPGEKLMVLRNSVPTEKWFSENLDNISAIDVGNSVANMNFSIAHTLECSPLILMGQDLAYSKDGRAHTNETGYDKFGDGDLNKKEEDIVEVENYDGKKIKSKRWWKIFKKWFEFKISKDKIDCIDATEGGAYIKGSDVMTFAKVANLFLSNNEKESFYDLVKSKSNDISVDSKVGELILNMKNLISEISSIKQKNISIKKETIKILKELNNNKNLSTVDKNYEKMENEINKLFLSNEFNNRFIFFLIQPIFINIHRGKVKIANTDNSSLNKNKKLINNFIDKISDIDKVLEKTLSILKYHLDALKEKYNKKDD